MDRLFLDANVLFSAAYRPDTKLLVLWKLKEAILCSSRYALEEARINLETEEQRKRLNALAESLQLLDVVETLHPLRAALPEKDQPILQAAIEIRATHLLTGDIHHFGAYMGKKIEGIKIMRPGDYLRTRVIT